MVPPEIDVWARSILAMPVEDVCAGAPHPQAYNCTVRAALLTDVVRRLGARSVVLANVHSNERYIDLDWGGGHVEAYGVMIGPIGWTRGVDPERKERRIREGVIAYDTRQ